MNTQRKKQINLDAVLKVQSYLLDLKKMIDSGSRFSPDKLAREHNISGSTATQAMRLDIIRMGDIKGEFTIGDNFGTDRITAKKVIEARRLADLERRQSYTTGTSQVMPKIVLQGDSNSKPEQDIVPELKRDIASDLAYMFKKLKIDQSNNNLFSLQEKEFEDKLKIACAIASGCYNQDSDQASSFNYESANNFIIISTNDLYEKLKNNK